MLWLVFECGAILTPILELSEPGYIENLIAGEIGGMQITPELILVLAIILIVPPFMAFLSLALKDSINRWALQPAYGVLLYISKIVASALIVWYAWKYRKQA